MGVPNDAGEGEVTDNPDALLGTVEEASIPNAVMDDGAMASPDDSPDRQPPSWRSAGSTATG
jgi:hypothetical protein